MDYEQLLELSPFDMDQKTKEVWYCEMFEQLTKDHKKRCEKYQYFLESFDQKENFKEIEEIPMLPVGIFKRTELKSIKEEEIFKTVTSSGTSAQKVSKIFLDEKNAAIQQRTLAKIMEEVIGKKRIPMIIMDSPNVFKDRRMFSARGAGILGFSILSSRRCFAFDKDMNLDIKAIEEFLAKYKEGPILIFGFTYMIWEYFYKTLKKDHKKIDLSRGILIHGGGWKKMQREAVSPQKYKEEIQKVSSINKIYDYYGMAEQTGCIYLECECGHLHASIFSDILIRDMKDFSVCEIGKEGCIEVLSPAATAYPGQAILTEDQGILLGIDDCPCGRKGKYFKVTGRMKHAEVRGCSDTYGA